MRVSNHVWADVPDFTVCVCVWLKISSLQNAASEPPIKLMLLEPNFSLGWECDSSMNGPGAIGILDVVVYIPNVSRPVYSVDKQSDEVSST